MDTTRGDRCSVNGYDRETTPRLEKLASEGLTFRNAWCPAGWTGPSHASLFTGLRPDRHGYFQGNREFLDDRAVTLAERMRNLGYRTACFSNNPNVSEEFGLTQGFQKVVPLFDAPPPIEPPSVRTHEQALEWVRETRKSGAPFFLFINDIEPHLPYTPPVEFARRFISPDLAPETVSAARNLQSEQWFSHNLGIKPVPPEQIRALSDLYDAEIAFLDQEVGRLADALRGEGLFDEMLFIVTSDHGEYLGEHGMLSHEFGLYRSLRYVPLVIRLPGVARAGEVSDQVVRLEDVYATIEDVCRLPAPRSIDGKTLLGDQSGRRALGVRGPPRQMLEGLRQEQKLTFDMPRFAVGITAEFDGRFHRIDYSDGRVEVFDILADPTEAHPIR
jgi:arylsulfatase A-like enzyme